MIVASVTLGDLPAWSVGLEIDERLPHHVFDEYRRWVRREPSSNANGNAHYRRFCTVYARALDVLAEVLDYSDFALHYDVDPDVLVNEYNKPLAHAFTALVLGEKWALHPIYGYPVRSRQSLLHESLIGDYYPHPSGSFVVLSAGGWSGKVRGVYLLKEDECIPFPMMLGSPWVDFLADWTVVREGVRSLCVASIDVAATPPQTHLIHWYPSNLGHLITQFLAGMSVVNYLGTHLGEWLAQLGVRDIQAHFGLAHTHTAYSRYWESLSPDAFRPSWCRPSEKAETARGSIVLPVAPFATIGTWASIWQINARAPTPTTHERSAPKNHVGAPLRLLWSVRLGRRQLRNLQSCMAEVLNALESAGAGAVDLTVEYWSGGGRGEQEKRQSGDWWGHDSAADLILVLDRISRRYPCVSIERAENVDPLELVRRCTDSDLMIWPLGSSMEVAVNGSDAPLVIHMGPHMYPAVRGLGWFQRLHKRDHLFLTDPHYVSVASDCEFHRPLGMTEWDYEVDPAHLGGLVQQAYESRTKHNGES